MGGREFIANLALTARDWRVESGKLRRGDRRNPECPITAVASERLKLQSTPAAAVLQAARRLHMSPKLISEIVKAADNHESCDPLVRMELLEACGLLVEERNREVEEAGR